MMSSAKNDPCQEGTILRAQVSSASADVFRANQAGMGKKLSYMFFNQPSMIMKYSDGTSIEKQHKCKIIHGELL